MKQTEKIEDTAHNFHNVELNRTFIDVRSRYQKFKDSSTSPFVLLTSGAVLIGLSVLNPLFVVPTLPLYAYMSTYNRVTRRNKTLPIKLPIDKFGQLRDFHQKKISNPNEFDLAEGKIFYGNCRKTCKEIWFTPADFLTHLLYLSTTGGGKSEGLKSLSGSISFCTGGALIYLDAKAAPDVPMDLVGMARLVGREDQIRIISFNDGGTDGKRKVYTKLSNTTNTFAIAPPDVCVQIIEGMMPEGGGNNEVFKDKALVTLNALMPCLCELRDLKIITIHPSLIASFATVKILSQIAYPEYFDNKITYQTFGDPTIHKIENKISILNREAVRMFISKLPGFSEEEEAIVDPSKQDEQVERQFGFGEGYFLKSLATLSQKYGHIFECELGEADFADCIFQNRILIIMIPATQSSKSQRKLLGQLNLTSLRLAISQGLGDFLEGDVDEIMSNLPIDKEVPSLMIIDEYPEAAVKGFAVTATQGRGLGMCCVFSGQEFAGFLAADQDEANQIFGNTVIKSFGTILEPEKTVPLIQKLAGKTYVAESAGFESDTITGYSQKGNVTLKEVDRISIDLLRNQDTAEVTLLYKKHLVFVKLFNHMSNSIKRVRNMRFVEMLQTTPPMGEDLIELNRAAAIQVNLEERCESKTVNKPRHLFDGVEVTDDNSWIKKLLKEGLEDTSISNSISNQDNGDENTADEIINSSNECEINIPTSNSANADDEATVQIEDEIRTLVRRAKITPSYEAAKKDNESIFHDKDWLLSFNTSADTSYSNLTSGLTNLMSSLGASEVTAKKAVEESLAKITKVGSYTSIPVPEEDKEISNLLSALDEIELLTERPK